MDRDPNITRVAYAWAAATTVQPGNYNPIDLDVYYEDAVALINELRRDPAARDAMIAAIDPGHYDLVGPSEAAAILGYAGRTAVDYHLRSGDIPVTVNAGSIRLVRRDDIEKYKAARSRARHSTTKNERKHT